MGLSHISEPLREIDALIRERAGVPALAPRLLQRRVQARIQHLRLAGWKDYLSRLRVDETETGCLAAALQRQSLDFDEEARVQLVEQVVPHLLGVVPPQRLLRVWVPACGNGALAYALAVLMAEAVGNALPTLKLFGTDSDGPAVNAARRQAPRELQRLLTPSLLARHFAETQEGFVAGEALRRRLVFAEHRLMVDPPLMEIDLVLAPTWLVDVAAPALPALLTRLHFALRPEGLLFTGGFTPPAEVARLFLPLPGGDRAWLPRREVQRRPSDMGRRTSMPAPHLRSAADQAGRLLLERLVHGALVVDEHERIYRTFGDVGALLGDNEDGGSQLLERLTPRALGVVERLLRRCRGGDVAAAEAFDGLHIHVERLIASAEPDHLLVSLVGAEPAAHPTTLPAGARPAELSAPLADAEAATPSATDVATAELRRTVVELHAYLRESTLELGSANQELAALHEDKVVRADALARANQRLDEQLQISAKTAADLERAEADLSRLNRHLATLVAERTALLELVQEATAISNRAPETSLALRRVVERLCARLGYPAGNAWVTTPRLRVERWRRPHQRSAAIEARHIDWLPQVAEALRSRLSFRPIWLPDLAAAAREHGHPLKRETRCSGLVIPIRVGPEVVGGVALAVSGPEPPLEVVDALVSVGDQLGRVVERDEARRDVVEAVWEAQRRTAADLHDGIGQQLAGSALLCNSLLRKLDDDPAASALAADVLEQIKAAHRDVRRLAKGLYPVGVGKRPLDLATALEELARETQEVHSVSCHFNGERARVPAGIATELYQVARESITNAVRHGSPRRVDLSLRTAGPRLVMEVRDDGRGLRDPQAGGIGLRIMRHRAESVGADFAIVSPPGGGVLVTCTLPIEPEEAP